MADGVTALAQLYALYSHRARSFSQLQRALYPNFIIKVSSVRNVRREFRERNLNVINVSIML